MRLSYLDERAFIEETMQEFGFIKVINPTLRLYVNTLRPD